MRLSGYRERNEETRKQFIERISQIESSKIVYVDEAGFDNRDDYPYGYSYKGTRCHALKSGKRVARISWIAALKEGKVFAPLTYEGCCNRHVFKTWLEKSLLPKLNPGNVIVIDNATFHKADATPRRRKAQGNAHQAGQSILEVVQNAGCEIWYLPPYSPDLNKIERWWSVLKTWMKQRIFDFGTIRECVDSAFAQCPNVFP